MTFKAGEHGGLWTSELKAEACRLWQNGDSASQVARALGLGFTRNMVIGAVHRAGMSNRPEASHPHANRALKAAPPPKAPRVRTGPPRLTIVRNAPAPRAPSVPLADVRTVTMMDLNSRFQCGWSVGEDAWCAEPKTPSGHFCATHKRIGVQRETKRPASQTVVARTRSGIGCTARILDERWS